MLNEISPDQLIYLEFQSSDERGDRVALLHALTINSKINYQLLFQYNKKPINYNIVDDHEWTPLHWACCNGNKEAVRLLVEHGANTNSTNSTSYLVATPLMSLLSVQINEDSIEILKLLIEYGADINKSNSIYSSPLLRFVLDGHCSECGPIGKEYEIAFLQKLLDSGANIGILDEDGNNALHLACKRGNIGFCQVLITAGCKYDEKNQWGILPIDLIENEQQRIEFLEILDLLQLR